MVKDAASGSGPCVVFHPVRLLQITMTAFVVKLNFNIFTATVTFCYEKFATTNRHIFIWVPFSSLQEKIKSYIWRSSFICLSLSNLDLCFKTENLRDEWMYSSITFIFFNSQKIWIVVEYKYLGFIFNTSITGIIYKEKCVGF